MSRENIYLNNVSISNSFLVESTENLIICNSLREEFFGIYTLKIGDKEILCENVDSNVVKCLVRIGEEQYKDIPFNLIVDKKAAPKVAINVNTLSNPSIFIESKKEEEEVKDIISENVKETDNTLLEENIRELEEKQNKISELEEEVKQLKRQNNKKQKIEESSLIDIVQTSVEKGVEEYKQKLYSDFFTANEEQNNLRNNIIEETISSLEEVFNERYIESVAELRNTTKEEVKTYTNNFLKDFQKILTEKHNSSIEELENIIESVKSFRDNTKKEVKDYSDEYLKNLENLLKEKQNLSIVELKTLIESTIKEDLFIVTDELQNKFNISIDENVTSLYQKLENYKQTLKDELSTIFESKDDLVKYTLEKDFNEKIATTKASLISDYIRDIEKNNIDLREEINQHLTLLNQKIDKKSVDNISFNSSELVKEAARLLIEEDSKANNKLNKFKDQLLKDLQKASEQYIVQANKRMMRYAEMMSGGGSTAMQFANGGTMQGNLNVIGKFLSGGVDIASLFGSGGGTGRDDVNTVVITNSAKWNTAYNTATSYQTASSSFANLNFLNSNFLRLTGGTIAGNLTIQGNISALGTSTFANTIFTTTSALSVYNTGPGPALYVYQAAGPYDVASFYDGDGIEVLHVGNAGPGGLGKVGVNESFPNEELTVRGSISATEVIYAENGNSTNWNTAYQNVSSQSLNTTDTPTFGTVTVNALGASLIIGDIDGVIGIKSPDYGGRISFEESVIEGFGIGLVDGLTVIINGGDPTKTARFDASNITANQQRNYFLPDADGTLALGNQTLNTTDNVEFNQVNANVYLSGGVNLFNILSSSGGGATPIKRFDYVTVANIDYSYSGTASFGTIETSPTWKLIRLTYANNGTVSNSASALNSWTGRLTASYITI